MIRKTAFGVYHENPAYQMSRVHLPDEVYAQTIRSFVIVCVDVVITSRQSGHSALWLAKRKVKPWSGWWLIGGRMYAGEDPIPAVQSVFKRETSLEINPGRFSLVQVSSFLWKDRQQEPQDAGSHNLSLTFMLDLIPSELSAVQLDTDEYDAEYVLRPFDREALVTEHPVLSDLHQQIFGGEEM